MPQALFGCWEYIVYIKYKWGYVSGPTHFNGGLSQTINGDDRATIVDTQWRYDSISVKY